MKHLFTLLAATLASVFISSAEDKTVYTYTDGAALPLYGKVCTDTHLRYSRLPGRLEGVSRKPVWQLGLNSAGLYLRFRSDAPKFDIRWSNVVNFSLDNMTGVTARGLALYVYDKGEWVYVNSCRPRGKEQPYSQILSVSKLGGTMHEYMLYLCLYDGAKDLSIGVPEGYKVAQPELDSPRAGKPIIFYGTSILQGASSSHPGLAGTAKVSRALDRQVINLGFSGNALLDYEIAELMAAYPDPGVYVMDNIPNGSPELTREKLAGFFRILRDAHPDTPVVFVEGPIYPNCRFDEGRDKWCRSRNEALREVYDGLRKAGEKRIYYVKSDKMLTEDNIGTVEGTHFTDIGFDKWVGCVLPVLRRL